MGLAVKVVEDKTLLINGGRGANMENFVEAKTYSSNAQNHCIVVRNYSTRVGNSQKEQRFTLWANRRRGLVNGE